MLASVLISSGRLVWPLGLVLAAIVAWQLPGAAAPRLGADTAVAAQSLEPSAGYAPAKPSSQSATTVSPDSQHSFRIAVLSDLNASYGSVTYGATVHEATRALLQSLQPDLVLITGDMVAGQKRGLNYAAMWEAFHTAVTSPLLAAGISVAPTPGNHDASPGAAFAKERAEYAAQWRLGERVPAVRFIDRARYPFYYSFEYGGVFFASLDAAAVGPLSVEQRSWLAAQLERSHHQTKIVFGHLPVHPFAIQRETEILADRELSALLQQHAVTAYISGHHHAYYPGVVNGVRHVAMPCLGGGARRLIGGGRVSPAALVILDIEAGSLRSLDAVRGPTFDTVIARGTLPQQLSYGRHRIDRDDVAGLRLWPTALARPSAQPLRLTAIDPAPSR